MNYVPKFSLPTQTPKEIAIARNALGYCSEPGCVGFRYGLSNYCEDHYRRVQQYGHPRAKPIGKTNFNPYRALVTDVIQANSAHPGFMAALAFVSQWQATSVADPGGNKASPELCRLSNDGITPTAILTEICSVWCWVQDNPRQLPDTKAENFALARGLLALSPRGRRYAAVATEGNRTGYAPRVNAGALKAIGATVRASLAFFLVNVYEAVSTREERAEATMQALRAPMVSPVLNQMLKKASVPATTNKA